MRSELLSKLRNTLRPELLNRLDDIVIFKSLTPGDARKIVGLLLEELNKRLLQKDIQVELTNALIKQIVKEGFSEEYGARPLRRELQDLVESALANYLLKGGDKKVIVLDYNNKKVVVKK
jgi:ATP-dependent Clp protease ATP-binding subunit ClpC